MNNRAWNKAWLGLEPGNSCTEVRKKYRDAALRLHPDKKGGSAEAFQQLQRLYEAALRACAQGPLVRVNRAPAARKATKTTNKKKAGGGIPVRKVPTAVRPYARGAPLFTTSVAPRPAAPVRPPPAFALFGSRNPGRGRRSVVGGWK